MSQIQLLRNLEAEEAALNQRIAKIREQVKSLDEVVQDIKRMAEEKGLNVRDIALELAPELNPDGKARKNTQRSGGFSTSTRAPRRVKTYRNPETGDEIQTKGGNHKELKAWKAQYGAETVDSWLVQDND